MKTLSPDQLTALCVKAQSHAANSTHDDIMDMLHDSACEEADQLLKELEMDSNDLASAQLDQIRIAYKTGFWAPDQKPQGACDMCHGKGYVLTNMGATVQVGRCNTCQRFSNDLEAAQFVCRQGDFTVASVFLAPRQ